MRKLTVLLLAAFCLTSLAIAAPKTAPAATAPTAKAPMMKVMGKKMRKHKGGMKVMAPKAAPAVEAK